MKIKRIQQRGPTECGVASLAMITGLPYEEVLAPFAWRTSEGDGLSTIYMHEWLTRNGWAWQEVYKVHHLGGINQKKDIWPPKPWAPAHLIQARVSAGYHFAVMDADGRVFDPWDGARTSIDHPAYQEIASVIGLWKVSPPLPH